MKTLPLILTLSCLAVPAAHATVYPDATGEVAVGNYPHLDISSVEVTSDGGTVTFVIGLNGSPIATKWGKYLVGIRSGAGGSTTSNGWSRPIFFATGMTHWIGTWVDANPPNGGVFTFRDAAWSQTASPTVSTSASGVTITVNAADLALEPGETFTFDVYTSGGGNDGAVDAASVPTTSISNWPLAFTTSAPLSFTMPGTPALPAEWLANNFTPEEIALRPSGVAGDNSDPDSDTLTNLTEYQRGTNPRSADSDDDGLSDRVETGTAIYVSAGNTGSNPLLTDTDGDGFSDGSEVTGTSTLEYVSNPNIRNAMVVAGSFNAPSQWNAAGTAIPTNRMGATGTSLTTQYQWALDTLLTPGGSTVEFKFTSLSFAYNWGNGSPGIAAPNGGNLSYIVAASGIHRFQFDQLSLAYSVTRPDFPAVDDFLTAYGLTGSTDDTDADGVTDPAEFAANTNPLDPDTDGDGIFDNVDPAPLTAAPLSRNVIFSVNMNTRLASGQWDGVTPPVRLIGVFNNWDTTGGVILTDPENDGIFSGTLSVAGVSGSSFGGYKFYNDFYENGNDRTFLAGPADVIQNLPAVFYSGDSNFSTPYARWANGAELAGTNLLSTANPDGDASSNLAEYLFGGNPTTPDSSSIRISRDGSTALISWAALANSAEAAYRVDTSTSLDAGWTDSGLVRVASADQSDAPPGYIRYEVAAPLTPGRNYYRVNGRTL